MQLLNSSYCGLQVCLAYRKELRLLQTHEQNAVACLRPLLIEEVRRVLNRWRKHFAMLQVMQADPHSASTSSTSTSNKGGQIEGVAATLVSGKSGPSSAHSPALYELEARSAQLTQTELTVTFQSELKLAELSSEVLALQTQLQHKQEALAQARAELDAFKHQSQAARQALAHQIAEVLAKERQRLAAEEKRFASQVFASV
jgi:hypothetical protein